MLFKHFSANPKFYLAASIAVVLLLAMTTPPARSSAASQKKKAQKPPAQSQDRGIKGELDRQEALKLKAQADARGVGLVDTLPGKSKRFALIIGIDQYSDSQMSPLSGATNDARLLAAALVKHAGFPPDQVVLLASNQPADRKPTRGNILRRLSNLAAVVPKDGLLLFSFAGHGIERNNQAFLLPSDAQVSNDVNLLEQTAVNVVQIKDWIRKTGVGQVILLLDACRNDPAAGRAAADNPLTKAYTRGFDFNVRNREVTAFATLYATEIGSRAYEFSEKRQGYFTWALVEGLRGKAANERGEVTLSALVKYLQDTVPQRVLLDLGRGKTQKPFAVVEGYRANDLVLASKEGATTSTPAGSPSAKTVESNEPPTPADTTEATQMESGREAEPPKSNNLTGTTWTGNSPELIDGEYTIEFLKDGGLNYIFNRLLNGKMERTTVKGKWRQADNFVQITIGNAYSAWQGKLDGAIIKGSTGNVEGDKRDFMLLKKTP